MKLQLRVLVAEDDYATGEMLVAALVAAGHEAIHVDSGEAAWPRLRAGDIDILLTDVSMIGMGGIELCRRCHASSPDVPVVVMTGHGDIDIAVAALRAGACEFLQKPVAIAAMLAVVARVGAPHRRGRTEQRLREVLANSHAGANLLGPSAALREVVDLVVRVADSDANVLVLGESGTGKELVARAIHDCSARRRGPFSAVNCAAVPATLIESELFGHVRGAFTDAKSASAGLFVQANGGTLFLDEIGELPLALQPKLLRVLQEHRVRPVGAEAEVAFDTRFVAATNRNLEAMVAAGTFREDLFYRLDVVRIELPPLRRRREDIVALAEHLLVKLQSRMGTPRVGAIAASAASALAAYDWPGNVRELENVMERALALAGTAELPLADLPVKIREFQPPGPLVIATQTASELVSLVEFERRYILSTIELLAGNKSKAARVLGLDRRTLYRRIDES